ncbi:MAG: ATP-binding protein [Acidimicrobiales bacterium]
MADPLFDAVLGQERAVAALRAAAIRPVHAYLFVGPPGTGKSAAATGFAAALLCRSDPPDGTCDSCRRVLAGGHPDVVSVEREGAAISVGMAHEVTRQASLSPVEGDRKVIVLHDFHLVRDAGPALLKTIEEPPATTFFVVLAEHVPPELVTIASRCVRIDFDPLTPAQVAAALRIEGVEAGRAAELAEASGGRLDRARLLAADEQFEARRRAWRGVVDRLDGRGAIAATIADELVAMLDSSVAPLRARQSAEREALEERNARAAEVGGTRRGGSRSAGAQLGAGVRELEERHKREQRRQRTDELRGGLGALAGAYRDRLAAGRRRAAALDSIDLIDKLARDLMYNPGEVLALQGLLTRLGRVAAPG